MQRPLLFVYCGGLSATLNSCSVEIRQRSKQNCRNDQFRYYTASANTKQNGCEIYINA